MRIILLPGLVSEFFVGQTSEQIHKRVQDAEGKACPSQTDGQQPLWRGQCTFNPGSGQVLSLADAVVQCLSSLQKECVYF